MAGEGGPPSRATCTLVTQPPWGYRELCALREGQGDLSDNAELQLDNSASSAVGTTAFHRVPSVLLGRASLSIEGTPP